jgi:hypothetical protein
MSGFLYYLPSRSQGLKPAEARAAGLDYAIDDRLTAVDVVRGPDGGRGVLIANPNCISAAECANRPDQQTWAKGPIWIGMAAASRPGPASLARTRQLGGHVVRLLDGADWIVPIARGWVEEDGDAHWYHALPRRSVFIPPEDGEPGTWQPGGVVEAFAPLWELANRWLQAEAEAAAAESHSAEGGAGSASVKASFDFSGAHEAAVEALAVNYRIGPTEASLLGLLSADVCREVLDALVDRPTLVAWLQKKTVLGQARENAGGNIAAG